MKDLWTIFKWNFQRFFAKPPNNVPWGTPQMQNESFCAAAIGTTVKEKGKKWLIPANFILFSIGLILLFADDYIETHTLSLIVHIIAISAACAFLILKFDAWKIQDDKNILKLFYIFGMSLTGGYASLTYIFLILYENAVAFSYWGGI